MVKNRITQVLEFIKENGGDDGEHHKQWALDQIVRILTNCPKIGEYGIYGESRQYKNWVKKYQGNYNHEYEMYDYEWDVGVPP